MAKILTISKYLAYSGVFCVGPAYKEAYRGVRINVWYRRMFPRPDPMFPPPPPYCINPDWTYEKNNPCPICRDEYLWFDHRNPKLLQMFMIPGTLHPIDHKQSNLCQEQYTLLQVEIEKAVECGYLIARVPHRVYDYRQYYPKWSDAPTPEHVDPKMEPFPRPRPPSNVVYPAVNPDEIYAWDPYWVKWDEFADKE